MTPEQYESRVAALATYIEEYINSVKETKGISLVIQKEDAAKNICELYDRYTEDIVRHWIKGSQKGNIIQNFKIIANTELAAIRIFPITIDGEAADQIKKYNVGLAIHIATSFLIDWNEIDPFKARKVISTDEEIIYFLEEHATWLYLLDTRFQFPLFSNSQVWRLFYYLLRDRVKTI